MGGGGGEKNPVMTQETQRLQQQRVAEAAWTICRVLAAANYVITPTMRARISGFMNEAIYHV